MATQDPKSAEKSAFETMTGLANVLSGAAEQGRVAVEAGLEAWAAESQHFYEELARQGKEAIHQLKACQSPLEVLQVEQAWVSARSKAYLESGLRFAQAFAAIARGHEANGEGEDPTPKAPSTVA